MSLYGDGCGMGDGVVGNGGTGGVSSSIWSIMGISRELADSDRATETCEGVRDGLEDVGGGRQADGIDRFRSCWVD